MKKIFVPLPINHWTKASSIPLHGAEETYFKKVIHYGLTPILVTSLLSRDQAQELYDLCDGVYYLGGEDIEPKWYKAEKHAETAAGEQPRDAMEIPFLQQAIADRKPYFGVCRGCQALAVAAGGTLLQHVADVTKEPHVYPRGEEYKDMYDSLDDLFTSPKHPIHLATDSKTYRIMQQETVMVNTGHHQAVDQPGKDMRVVGKSPGGIAEVVEHIDPHYFCIAVQSHPEVEEHSFFEPLFAAFAQAVQAQKR